MRLRLLLCLILLLGLSPAAHAADFPDVPKSHNNYVAINHLSDIEILKGYGDGSFQPDKTVNRVEALKVILQGAGITSPEMEGESGFSDVKKDQWFGKYVMKAKSMGIVKGNPDGSFAPARQVKRVEFIKMLLETNNFKKNKWEGKKIFADVPADSWYTPYMNYAGKSGLIVPTGDGRLQPENVLTRGEVAEILYLMRIILSGKNTQFLINQAENHMAQVDIYMGAKKVVMAKRSSELAYDFTQQALINMPEDKIVLAAAKIAKGYDLLMDAFFAALKKDSANARTLAEQVKVKATEAWEANNEVQPIAKHLKNKADEILNQL